MFLEHVHALSHLDSSRSLGVTTNFSPRSLTENDGGAPSMCGFAVLASNAMAGMDCRLNSR